MRVCACASVYAPQSIWHACGCRREDKCMSARACMRVLSLIFAWPFSIQADLGLAFAANIRIGQFLGNGDPEGATNSYRVVISIACQYFIVSSSFVINRATLLTNLHAVTLLTNLNGHALTHTRTNARTRARTQADPNNHLFPIVVRFCQFVILQYHLWVERLHAETLH